MSFAGSYTDGGKLCRPIKLNCMLFLGVGQRKSFVFCSCFFFFVCLFGDYFEVIASGFITGHFQYLHDKSKHLDSSL